MADKSTIFITDNVGSPDLVIANTVCNEITIVEDNAATMSYRVREPASASAFVTRNPGQEYTFYAGKGALFAVGQIVGSTELASAGAITMSQIESFQ